MIKKHGPAAAGALTAALGLLIIAGWHAGRMDLVRLQPAWSPMQYEAAFCFLLCGAGLAALAFGRRRPAAALGGAAAALAAWSLLRAVLGVEFGLETFLSDAARSAASPPSLRVEPLSSLAFLLAGGALSARALSAGEKAARAALLAGAVLMGFGAAVFLCYAGGISSAFGWEAMTRVPPQAGIGFAVLGLGLLLQAWPQDDGDAAEARWLPAAAGLGAAVAALFLWTALKAEERVRIQWHVDAAAAELAETIEAGAGGRRGKLRPEQLFGSILRAGAPPAHAFAVYLGRERVYLSPGAVEPGPKEYRRDVEVRLGGEAGWVRVWPSAELLRVERSLLPAAVGAVGMILALLLGWSLHLARLARRQAREISAASAAKSRFLANISREFGNPLNAIIGFGEILSQGRDGPLSPEQAEDVGAILGGGRRLASLMGELMELARLEAGRLKASPRPVAGGDILDALRAQFAAEAASRGLSLRVEKGGGVGLVLADPELLRRALAGLLANALKFTPQGEIVVSLRADDGEAVFSVRDTGAGLARDEKERLFEPFWQSRRLNGVKRTEGLGLGLHLARRLVELQGGRLTAAIAGGGGAEFLARLPRSRPAAALKEDL